MDWNELYADDRYCLKDPAREVVEIEPLLESIGARRILDLGYGAGRHIVYLARKGYEMYGTDISSRGEQITQAWLKKEGLRAELRMSDMSEIPYDNDHFCACINRGVITHNRLEGIRACISEMNRTLRPGGVVMCTFISTESSEFGKGVEVERNTWVPQEGIESGVPHHFVDEVEVRELMSVFEPVSVYHMKHGAIVDSGTPYTSAHWVYVGKKRAS